MLRPSFWGREALQPGIYKGRLGHCLRMAEARPPAFPTIASHLPTGGARGGGAAATMGSQQMQVGTSSSTPSGLLAPGPGWDCAGRPERRERGRAPEAARETALGPPHGPPAIPQQTWKPPESFASCPRSPPTPWGTPAEKAGTGLFKAACEETEERRCCQPAQAGLLIYRGTFQRQEGGVSERPEQGAQGRAAGRGAQTPVRSRGWGCGDSSHLCQGFPPPPAAPAGRLGRQPHDLAFPSLS